MVETNEVLYPNQFDSVLNFPDVTEITEASGEEVNRNRDAIIRLERTLGIDPHIGLYTENIATATVDERLDIIENGIAEGRFAFRNLNVNNALVVTTDALGGARVDVGGDINNNLVAPVFIRGPLRIVDSGLTSNQAEVDVPVRFNARHNVMEASAIVGESVFRITDNGADPNVLDRYALEVDGNVIVRNGRLTAEFAIEHSKLLGIQTEPRGSTPALHVDRGNFHSHKRKRDPATGALLNEVDANPTEETFGLVDHFDLLNIGTIPGQADFIPIAGQAYHVTGGDFHDHRDGRGAPIDHNFLFNVDPQTSNHVSGGNQHAHRPGVGDGAPINHNDLLGIGFLTHPEIDQYLNVDFKEHIATIDPQNADAIDEAARGSAAHVPLGHVSDPDAHHARYTDEEALSSEVLIAADTTVYEEGRNTTVRSHIQTIGSGTVSAKNPHGLAAADIGALEGFDPQGNLPDFTEQFLEDAIRSIITDPEFGVPLADEDATIIGIWEFSNSGGVINLKKGASPTISISYDDIKRLASGEDDDVFAHIDNTLASPAGYHASVDISYDNTASGLAATEVKGALDELKTEVDSKEDTLSASNQVTTAQIADLAVTNAKIANGTIANTKLANPYVVVTYTFTSTALKSDIAEFGTDFPAGVSGEIIKVTAMRSGGASADVNVDVLTGTGALGAASTILNTSPTQIEGFTNQAPGDVTLVAGTHTITGGTTRMFVVIEEAGAVAQDITVVVHAKVGLIS